MTTVSWMSSDYPIDNYDGPPRNVAYINQLDFDSDLQPVKYEIAGTAPSSKVLILDVEILEATGREPYRGDVLIAGQRFAHVGKVPNKEALLADSSVRVFYGKGRTLMPGLGDSHTHFTWNGGDLDRLGDLGVEEHTLLTARSAECFLDSGYTMCFGAASAKKRLDVVIRDAINAGDIPGPRFLANGQEMARTGGGTSRRNHCLRGWPRANERSHIDIGVDQVKLSMSGESIRDAEDCYFTQEETAACVDEAHKHKKRVCSHARARDSVQQSIDFGVDVIYHASYIDEKGMDALEKRKSKHVVAPAINWLIATLYDAVMFGYPTEKAEQVGYLKELTAADRAMREMHRRGIVVLPGGDYGFAWTPHGTYARDLAHFVDRFGFTSHESIIAATYGMAKLFMRSHEMGQIKEGNYADCLVVDGDPLKDISILQDHDRLNIIMINGRVHKAGVKEYVIPMQNATGVHSMTNEMVHLELQRPIPS
ncbi:hypothetical protein N7481_011322 [Penicillium waksmanii]|uniref:uncharacterized protein n=1 Tax=Penicillium waksmanii TaxID=69791 RepID=UPI002546FEF2|nr:uncharacterized protein N7481_011322 [Penicillium waksmanii]KAJ5974112.1 hypothetical protein N7481_011322 [Penicillium waksmanii]